MTVGNYGVWKGKPVRYTYEDRRKDNVSRHLSLFYTDNEPGEGRAAINIKSQGAESRLAYWTVSDFRHPITTSLATLSPGFKPLTDTQDQGPGGLALDFIRGNLFDRSKGRVLPHDVDGPDNDIIDQLKPILDRAIAARSATVYLYGSAFDDGKGIHNNHMNQGNTGRWKRDNGIYQDGGLIIHFPGGGGGDGDQNNNVPDRWEAIFIAFASQAVHTDDGPDKKHAGNPLPPTGFLTWADFLAPEKDPQDRHEKSLQDSPVVIASALIRPPGKQDRRGLAPEMVTLRNRTEKDMGLSRWSIRSSTGKATTIEDGVWIPSGGPLTIWLSSDTPLSNDGGTITLLDKNGLKVSGVSYSKEQAGGGTILWL